jgi:hypothetical protein
LGVGLVGIDLDFVVDGPFDLFGVLALVAEVVALHFQEKDFAFGSGALLEDVVIDDLEDVIAEFVQLLFNIFFIVFEQCEVLAPFLFFLLVDVAHGSPGGSARSHRVLISHRD